MVRCVGEETGGLLRLIVKTAVGVCLAMGLLALIVPTLQRRLMYYPDTTYYTPAEAGLPGVEEVTLETPDGERVLAWYAPAKPGRRTVLYFHGNAGSLEARSARIAKYMARGLGVFMMTYRGFGGSTGSPSEAANVADALLAYNKLTALGVDPLDVIVYGESLGTGVAVQVAGEKRVGGLVLDAPYTSMVDLAALHYPLIPGRWFMTDRYETRSNITEVSAPLLIIHGEQDRVVPIEMGRQVFALAPEPKTLRTFPQAGHDDHYKFGSYDTLFQWIDDLGRPERQASEAR